MKCLEYPFDSAWILKKKRGIRRELLAQKRDRVKKKIAVLGGSTVSEVIDILELFLLDAGIEPLFYQSEYGRYYEEAVFPNEKLKEFQPDLIYVHTSLRNLQNEPVIADDMAGIDAKISEEMHKFTSVWDHLWETYHCPIIQNNMELPANRLLGNQDGVFCQGKTYFVREINQRMAQYAREHEYLYIHDLEYLASRIGLDQFGDPFYWHMYKYFMTFQVIPEYSYSLANVIKSLFGKNKKGLVLDLDNTLWGGVIGDDGVEGIELGQETSMGQVYGEFQQYVKDLKQIGVFLAVNSKNEEENAMKGLQAPYAILKPEDFLVIKANWEPKDRNFQEIAETIGVLPDSLVFVDDNPAEREIVTAQLPGVLAPAIERVEHYARILDHAGYFEVTTLSEDDKKRNEMYQGNIKRAKLAASFTSYEDYLKSLEMKAQIRPFEEIYLARIAQLTNKSNQFNLTTRRYSQAELAKLAESEDVVTLYGALSDRFGDNGIVSVLMGHEAAEDEQRTGQFSKALHLDLWLMSCRVLKRDMERAMMDALVEECRKRAIQKIYGYYIKTEKNAMVKDFYGKMGFSCISEGDNGDSKWLLDLTLPYESQNRVILVEP